ncbi:hypothetical protein J6338_14095, partial [Staphylococcus aureus]|nr:hypothetical protein [Staphylococcus aureus]
EREEEEDGGGKERKGRMGEGGEEVCEKERGRGKVRKKRRMREEGKGWKKRGVEKVSKEKVGEEGGKRGEGEGEERAKAGGGGARQDPAEMTGGTKAEVRRSASNAKREEGQESNLRQGIKK